MSQNTPVQLDVTGYAMFFGFMIVVLVGLIWYLRNKERDKRNSFFGQFEKSDLRMSRYQIGLVYRIVATESDEVVVVPIWNGKARVLNAQEQRYPTDELIPFDPVRF